MKNIYPDFYDFVPIPTSDGFLVFHCDKCHTSFLPQITNFTKKVMLCPYCGYRESINYFYEQAYIKKVKEYQLQAIKNLLALVNKDISDSNIQEALCLGYNKLQELASKKELELTTKVNIYVEDIVNLDDFIEIKTSCCNKSLRVMINKQKLNYCLYCDE
ncbi:MAG TPA: hypothetical protein VIK84_03490 [Haloplasmataceae bacterium]